MSEPIENPNQDAPAPGRWSDRSVTSLFRLVERLRVMTTPAGGGDPGEPGKPREATDVSIPCYHPGQNPLETYLLAWLIAWLFLGACMWAIAGVFGAGPLAVVVAIPVGGLVGIIGLHFLFLVLTGALKWLRRLHLLAPSENPRAPEWLYFILFTILAVTLVITGDRTCLVIALPWLIWMALNLLSWILLELLDLVAYLGNPEA